MCATLCQIPITSPRCVSITPPAVHDRSPLCWCWSAIVKSIRLWASHSITLKASRSVQHPVAPPSANALFFCLLRVCPFLLIVIAMFLHSLVVDSAIEHKVLGIRCDNAIFHFAIFSFSSGTCLGRWVVLVSGFLIFHISNLCANEPFISFFTFLIILISDCSSGIIGDVSSSVGWSFVISLSCWSTRPA